MTQLRLRAVQTRHGVIYGRNALILESSDLRMAPLKLTLTTSLSLANCRPPFRGRPDVRVIFAFSAIRRLVIHPLDDYPDESSSQSSFDEYVDEEGRAIGRFVLSTYDHVFDVQGRCDLTDGSPAS